MFLPFIYLILPAVASLRVDGQPSRSTFSVSQVANPNYIGYATSGPAALARTYAKHAKAAFNDKVCLGSPPQSLFLDFDTGSSDLWVFSSITDPYAVGRQKLYAPEKSKTARKINGASWKIKYGDGTSAYGDVYLDQINVGGIVVKSQAIEAAKNVSDRFTANAAESGLLGLAFGSINTIRPAKQATFFDNVKGVLAEPLFTADLKNDAFGTYDFGYVDQKKKTSPITWTSVDNSQGFWEISSTVYAVGNKKFVKTSIDGIVDTGTTLLYLPDEIVQDYYRNVNGSTFSTIEGGWVFPCDNDNNPDFIFGIGARCRGREFEALINDVIIDLESRDKKETQNFDFTAILDDNDGDQARDLEIEIERLTQKHKLNATIFQTLQEMARSLASATGGIRDTHDSYKALFNRLINISEDKFYRFNRTMDKISSIVSYDESYPQTPPQITGHEIPKI
ncbi:secreted aspartic proteinase precursor [Fusarium bulbicola]|nr:secreted aspartic proteinase precursor [Fusarium bulbicola]